MWLTEKINKSIGVFACIAIALGMYSPKALAANPQSGNFEIEGDSLISTGFDGAESTNFGISGEINPFAFYAESTNFKSKFGYNPRIQANVPIAPTLSNPAEYYDRLTIVINTSSNPTDTLYALAISDDDFVTASYVQSDFTISGTLGIEDYNTYAFFGGGSGFNVIGLAHMTEYKVRAKALNGDFTETEWGPTSSAVETDVPKIVATIDTNLVDLGLLSANDIVTSNSGAQIGVKTNIASGYSVFISGRGDTSDPGLYSTTYLIDSSDTTLSAGSEGYGAQIDSSDMTVAAKYDHYTTNQVGGVELTATLAASKTTPSGTGFHYMQLYFLASIAGQTPPGDYDDVVTITVAPII